MLTQQRVKELFDYHDDGHLIWKVCLSNAAPIGSISGSRRYDGRFQVCVDGKTYMLHRLIFLWHKGYMPPEVDHEDRDTSHNWIGNLRAATSSQNKSNQRRKRNNKSGFKGVDWHKSSKTWRACITINGRHVHIGHFKTPEAAYAAYSEVAKQHHGEFFCPG